MVYMAHGWFGFPVLGTWSHAQIITKFLFGSNREIVGDYTEK